MLQQVTITLNEEQARRFFKATDLVQKKVQGLRDIRPEWLITHIADRFLVTQLEAWGVGDLESLDLGAGQETGGQE